MLIVRVESESIREQLWYVSIMQRRSANPPLGPQVPVSADESLPLSVIHAKALYRPVPPVELDEEGYVCRDGKMPESTLHGDLLLFTLASLRELLKHRNACVAYDLALLFERGNPAAVLAPDLLVALDAGDHHRSSYKLWEEPKVPDLALEALSLKTWRKDVEVKPGIYRDLGVREFWLVDLLGKLPEPLVGLRLNAVGDYESIPVSPSGGYRSEVLGADLVPQGDDLRLRKHTTGEVMLHYPEALAQHREGEIARQAAEARADSAERRVADLEERLRRAEGR